MPEYSNIESYIQEQHAIYTEILILRGILQDHYESSPTEADERSFNDAMVSMLTKREEDLEGRIRDLSREAYYTLLP